MKKYSMGNCLSREMGSEFRGISIVCDWSHTINITPHKRTACINSNFPLLCLSSSYSPRFNKYFYKKLNSSAIGKRKEAEDPPSIFSWRMEVLFACLRLPNILPVNHRAYRSSEPWPKNNISLSNLFLVLYPAYIKSIYPFYKSCILPPKIHSFFPQKYLLLYTIIMSNYVLFRYAIFFVFWFTSLKKCCFFVCSICWWKK